MGGRVMNEPLKTPVVLFVFNRPDCTEKTMESIRAAKPERLYVIADAPRQEHASDVNSCAMTRAVIDRMIDWPCDLRRHYAEINLGCGQSIPSGLDWVFNHEEQAIILEDDIVADTSFYTFCQEMLNRYRQDSRIYQIAGYNQFHYRPRNHADYFFTSYSPIWGWATWRRAWNQYSRNITSDRAVIESIQNNTLSVTEAESLIDILTMIETGQLDSWAYHWWAHCLIRDGLCIVPSKNLIRNIGFGTGATHTLSPFTRERWRTIHTLPGPYKAPEAVSAETNFDLRVSSHRQWNFKIERIKYFILNLKSSKHR